MTKAQQQKVKTFCGMGYSFHSSNAEGTVWVSRIMPRGKVIFQEINLEGVTIRTFSQPIKEG